MAVLSIIIPYGTSNERSFIAQRVRQRAQYYQSSEEIEFIFIEGFCSGKDENLQVFIEQKGHKFYKDERQKKAFSLGACRDLGSLKASSKVLMFLDVDCLISKAGFECIKNLVSVRKIHHCENEFFCLPCFYLNEKANDFLENKLEEEYIYFIQKDFFTGTRQYTKSLAIASSILVINREKYLKLGGMSEAFIGHGYEDFEFFLRLLASTCEFQLLPANLSYDARNWDFINFEGFRALFSLFGYESAFFGLYALHFHHENPNQNEYLSHKEQNHALFFEKLKLFEQNKLLPLELQSKEKKYVSLDFIGYKPYLASIRTKSFNFLPSVLKVKLSQSKFYRLFRKFKSSPKLFFKESKLYRILRKK